MTLLRWLKSLLIICIIGTTIIGIPIYINNYQESYRIFLYNQLSPSIIIVKTNLGLGSGVVIKDGRYVVTAKHVIDGAKEIKIITENRNVIAKVIYTDETGDIAVLKLKRFKLKPIKKILPSSYLRVGQRVYAMGNPACLEDSFYEGIIAGLNRTILKNQKEIKIAGDTYFFSEYYYGIIQLDIGPAPGFSGGGVFNDKGELVGILTMGYQTGDIALVQPVDILLYLEDK